MWSIIKLSSILIGYGKTVNANTHPSLSFFEVKKYQPGLFCYIKAFTRFLIHTIEKLHRSNKRSAVSHETALLIFNTKALAGQWTVVFDICPSYLHRKYHTLHPPQKTRPVPTLHLHRSWLAKVWCLIFQVSQIPPTQAQMA